MDMRERTVSYSSRWSTSFVWSSAYFRTTIKAYRHLFESRCMRQALTSFVIQAEHGCQKREQINLKKIIDVLSLTSRTDLYQTKINDCHSCLFFCVADYRWLVKINRFFLFARSCSHLFNISSIGHQISIENNRQIDEVNLNKRKNAALRQTRSVTYWAYHFVKKIVNGLMINNQQEGSLFLAFFFDW